MTYARSSAEPEDIQLFDRENNRTISIYPSQRKLASRGRFYDEDAKADYDVLDYYVDTTFVPGREWIQGRTRLQMRIRAAQTATVSLRLAESLTVQSVSSEELGRLLHLRVRNQNTIVVNLPAPVLRDQILTINTIYSGPLVAQRPDREALQGVRLRGRLYAAALARAEFPVQQSRVLVPAGDDDGLCDGNASSHGSRHSRCGRKRRAGRGLAGHRGPGA